MLDLQHNDGFSLIDGVWQTHQQHSDWLGTAQGLFNMS